MKQTRSSNSQQRLVEGDCNLESSVLEVSNNNLDKIDQLYVDQEDRGVQNVNYDDIVWQFITEMDSDEESEMIR